MTAVTASAISRALSKAGFERSVRDGGSASRPFYTEGFTVRGLGGPHTKRVVIVQYRVGTDTPIHRREAALIRQHIETFAAALREAGYDAFAAEHQYVYGSAVVIENLES